MAAANTAQIDKTLLAAVRRLPTPVVNPFHDRIHQFVHAADGVHLLAAFAKRGVDVDPGAGYAHPHGAEVLEDNVHIGGLAQNAHVRQNAVVD